MARRRIKTTALPACAVYGVKFSVPGSPELWTTPNGTGSSVPDYAARFSSRESADKHVQKFNNTSVRARVVCLPKDLAKDRR